MRKKKSAALNSNATAVVKSTKVVPKVKAKGEYFEFDAYADAARIMLLRIDEIMNHKEGSSTGMLFGDLRHCYAAFDRGRKMFERDELYRMRKTARPNLTGCHTKQEITRRVVTEKIGLLLASFPNASPGNGEAYMGMMIEEIIAANPTATALEATCREIRRTKNFVPSTAEVLKELRQQAEKWDDALYLWEDDIEHWEKERARLVAASEPAPAKTNGHASP